MLGLVPFKFNNGENYKGVSINDMFQDFFNDDMMSPFSSTGNFKTDIKETPEEYIIQAELPGVKKGDINVDYNNNYLTISAIRSDENEEKGNNFIRRERHYGEISRRFYVANVDKKLINARFNDGVLSIELPKREKVVHEDNRIEIK